LYDRAGLHRHRAGWTRELVGRLCGGAVGRGAQFVRHASFSHRGAGPHLLHHGGGACGAAPRPLWEGEGLRAAAPAPQAVSVGAARLGCGLALVILVVLPFLSSTCTQYLVIHMMMLAILALG